MFGFCLPELRCHKSMNSLEHPAAACRSNTCARCCHAGELAHGVCSKASTAQAAKHATKVQSRAGQRALMVSTSMTSVSTTSGQQCPVWQGGTAGCRGAALPCAHCDGSRLLSRRLLDSAPSCEPTSLFASELHPELLLRHEQRSCFRRV